MHDQLTYRKHGLFLNKCQLHIYCIPMILLGHSDALLVFLLYKSSDKASEFYPVINSCHFICTFVNFYFTQLCNFNFSQLLLDYFYNISSFVRQTILQPKLKVLIIIRSLIHLTIAFHALSVSFNRISVIANLKNYVQTNF